MSRKRELNITAIAIAAPSDFAPKALDVYVKSLITAIGLHTFDERSNKCLRVICGVDNPIPQIEGVTDLGARIDGLIANLQAFRSVAVDFEERYTQESEK